MGTVQFVSAIQTAQAMLLAHFPSLIVPQAKPLSSNNIKIEIKGKISKLK